MDWNRRPKRSNPQFMKSGGGGGNKRGRFGEQSLSSSPGTSETVYRILCPSRKIGSVLGKGGEIIKALREDTQAKITVAESVPGSEERVVMISAAPAVAKRALHVISTLLHQNPRKDKALAVGGQGMLRPGLASDNFPPTNLMRPGRGSNGHAKIGAVIGTAGSNVRQLQQETGTNIHVGDASIESDERVICVSSFEPLSYLRSRTIDAILLLQDKTSDYNENGIVTTRILIPSSKVGCIIGQGGQVINEMRRRTKADIRVNSKEEKPKCAAEDEELVQVSGSYGVAKEVLGEIASRFRARCIRDGNPGVDSGPGPGFVPRGNFSSGGPPPTRFISSTLSSQDS
uniref:KH domain-containing protein n=1 Tax=Tanacetum cinerariifolium TaxID=118510 RepID=A0A699JXD0_TANCI|nr:KH domain-containing protein [Tanacetum cinerariifolium]